MTPASVAPLCPFVSIEDLDEHEARPMTDREHASVFGWSWDDPDAPEVGQ